MFSDPYTKGKSLALRTATGTTINATIERVFAPFTFGPVLLVRPETEIPSLPNEDIVLKLYDRRFAPDARSCSTVVPWTDAVEAEYQKFHQSGGASAFIKRLNTQDDMIEKESDTWNVAQEEAYMQNRMLGFYETERDVYQMAHILQGKDIPRFLGEVDFPEAECPGILLEYIDGFLLTDLATHAPQNSWQYICEDAISIVNSVGDLGIINLDVKTRNFIVRKGHPEEGKFKVYQIDFAVADFRENFGDDRSFNEAKAHRDEEGAVGMVMESKLAKVEPGYFQYSRSAKYQELDYQFMREELS
ncbi:hypothetical protein FQN57_000820 [Myotisia sp. PD_48]|nr:hypothetical protein FQN57_000820 [Myotisia sp. PD_48]